jgi:hypothetical protein
MVDSFPLKEIVDPEYEHEAPLAATLSLGPYRYAHHREAQ